MRDCARPFYWFYLQPAPWHAFVAALDGNLSPHFSLLQLSSSSLRRYQTRRLLISGFLLCPATVTLATIWLLGPNRSINGIWLGLTLGLLVGFVFALVVSFAAGILLAFFGTAAYLAVLGREGVITVDLLLQPRFGLVFGVCAAVAVSVLMSPTPSRVPYTRLRQAGSVVIGMVISGIVLAIAVGVTSLVVTNWQRGRFDSRITAAVIGLVPLSIFALAAGLRSRSWRRGLLGGAIIGVLVGLLTLNFLQSAEFEADIGGDALRGIIAVVVTAAFLVLFGLPYALADQLGGVWAGRVAGGLGSLVAHVAFDAVFSWYVLWDNLLLHFLLVALGITVRVWRPILFYPVELSWSVALPRLEMRRQPAYTSLLSRQPVFWDTYQYLPLVGLLDHLLLVAKRYPAELEPALTAISNSRQPQIARLAQIELEAQQLESLTGAAGIAQVHERLSAGLPTDTIGALLRSFRHVSLDVAAALNQHSSYNQRLALNATADRLNSLVRELTRSREPHALRFRPIAIEWHRLINEHMGRLQTAVAQRQEIDDPYIIGIPLTAQQEIFVGRRDISRRIEQLLLDQRKPPLLLYGQRRMGKTSLLNNLGRLLPQQIVPLFVDLQGPVSFATDHAGLLYNLARSMQRSAYDQRSISLPAFSRATAQADPFTGFDVWLDRVENQLVAGGETRILVMLDEFEALDEALKMGRFQETSVLGMLRHIIQHRHRFKVLLAGSHTLDEFKSWSGYLINAEVLHLECLKEREAKQLIEHPIPSFNLAYPPAVSHRAFTLTGGHPFLLQLLCSEIIALKNSQRGRQRWEVSEADIETAVPRALTRGVLFFADIETSQLDREEVVCLQRLAREGEGAIFTRNDFAEWFAALDNPEQTLQRLLLREVVTAAPGGFTFRIELVRRWFAAVSPAAGPTN